MLKIVLIAEFILPADGWKFLAQLSTWKHHVPTSLQYNITAHTLATPVARPSVHGNDQAFLFQAH